MEKVSPYSQMISRLRLNEDCVTWVEHLGASAGSSRFDLDAQF
jgi:hypothetical protein